MPVPYDLQLYPRKTHSIAALTWRVHLFNRILNHFEPISSRGAMSSGDARSEVFAHLAALELALLDPAVRAIASRSPRCWPTDLRNSERRARLSRRQFFNAGNRGVLPPR